MRTRQRNECLQVNCLIALFGAMISCQGVQGQGSTFQDSCDSSRVDLVCNAATGWSVSGKLAEAWKGCAPKACKSFPAVSNGHTKPAFGRVDVGDTVEVFCDQGYELDGNPNATATPRCQPDCTFEPHQRCQKKVCTADFEVENGIVDQSRLELALGDAVAVVCNDGYMPSGTIPIFQESCPSSFTKTCQADASFSNSDISCIPIACPAYPPNDVSLECSGECGFATGSIVGVVSTTSSVGFGEQVFLTCSPGYRWNTGDNETLTCSSNCLFQSMTDERGSCVPQTCTLPERDSNASNWPEDLTSVNYGSSLTLQCARGYASPDLCLPERTYACSVLDFMLRPELDQAVQPCVPAVCNSDNFPANMDAVNTSGIYGFDSEVIVPCLSGYRAVAIGNGSQTDLETGTSSCTKHRETSMTLRCGSAATPCGWVHSRQCLPVVCNLSTAVPPFATPSVEDPVIRFSETVTVNCDFGFRIRNVSDDLASRDDDTAVTLRCRPDCSLHADPFYCVPTACGDFVPGPTQTLLGDGSSMVHGDSVQLTCNLGLIPQGSTTTTCESVFDVTCVDGLFVGNTTCRPPSCGNGCELPCVLPADPNSHTNVSGSVVSIEHGTELAVRCLDGFRAAEDGRAQCGDPFGYVVSCDKMCVSETRTCEVLCVESEDFEENECSANEFQQNCRAVQCFSDHLVPENGFAVQSGFTVYGESATIECIHGYRMWFGTGSGEERPAALPGTEPQGMTALCNSTCDLEGRREVCVITTCGQFVPTEGQVLVNASLVEGAEFLHGDSLLVRCGAGLAPNGVIPPDCNNPFEIVCDDGMFSGNFECLTPVRHGCPEFVDPRGTVTVSDADFERRVDVQCERGFVAWDFATNQPPPPEGCGVTSYSDVCTVCTFGGDLRCVRSGCGRFEPRTVEGRSTLESVIQDPEFVEYTQNVTIVCPTGTQLGTSDSTEPQPTSINSTCQATCTFPAVPHCFPITCGFYQVPERSVGRFRSYNGVLSSQVLQAGEAVELFYNETVVVTCDQRHILTAGDADCSFEAEVTCDASGAITNADTSCKRRACDVLCETGTAWGGFGGGAFDCSFNFCPPTAPRMYVLPEGCPPESPSRCQLTQPCTPIVCEDFTLPAGSTATHQAADGDPQELTGDLRFAVFGHSVNVTCHDGLVPELELPDANSLPTGPMSDAYVARCQDDGMWSDHPQLCLAETCVVLRGDFSCGVVLPRAVDGMPWLQDTVTSSAYQFRGDSVNVTCPEGTRLNSFSADGAVRARQGCNADCGFDFVPICTPVACGTFEVPMNSSARKRGANGTRGQTLFQSGDSFPVLYNESVILTCNRGTILSTSDADCAFETELRCLSSGMMTAEGLECLGQTCTVSCERGTRYGGLNGTDHGCASGACPVTAPQVYSLPEGCSETSASRCFEIKNCTPVACGALFPPPRGVFYFGDPSAWDCVMPMEPQTTIDSNETNVTSPDDESISGFVYGQRVQVVCEAGYATERDIHRYRTVTNDSTTANLSLTLGSQCLPPFDVRCQDDGTWSDMQQCLADTCAVVEGQYSCGMFEPRPVDGRPWSLDSVEGGFVMFGENALVTCPEGTRLGSNSVDAPSSSLVPCNMDCTYSPLPTCQPISCGPFQVPSNSTALKRGADGVLINNTFRGGDLVNMHYDESLVVTCDLNYILEDGSADCSFETEVTCLASGEFDRGVGCKLQMCSVVCEDGRAWGGTSGVDNGCTATLCPPTAPREYTIDTGCPPDSVSRCDLLSSCTAPVACDPFEAPADSSTLHQQFGGFLFPLIGTLNGAAYGHTAFVTCNNGLMPEGVIPTANLTHTPPVPTESTYISVCDINGTWSDHPQQCLSANCLQVSGQFSCGNVRSRPVVDRPWMQDIVPAGFILVNESAPVTCPTGTRVGSDNASAVSSVDTRCRADCIFDPVPPCVPISCGTYQLPLNSSAVKFHADGTEERLARGTEVELLYDDHVRITCDSDFALNGTDYDTCAFHAETRCLDNGELSATDLRCSVNICRRNFCVYEVENQTVKLPPRLDALVGASIDVECAAGYVTADSAAQGLCNKTFSPLCQRGAIFTRQDQLQCQPAFCPPLVTADPHALRTSATTSPVRFGDSVSVQCVRNFAAGGVPFATYTARCGAADEDQRVCDWSLPDDVCQPVACPTEPPLPNASLVLADGDRVLAGQTVAVQCNLGLRLDGPLFSYQQCVAATSVRCLETGQLEPVDAACVPIVCPSFSSVPTCSLDALSRKPVAPEDRETRYGEQLQLMCPREEGTPSETIQCSSSCQLTPYTLSCDPVTCSPLEAYNISRSGSPRSGRRGALGEVEMVAGSRLSLECGEGYEPVAEWHEDRLDELEALAMVLWQPSMRYQQEGCPP